MNPELQTKILLWRAKGADGTLTPEDMREALAALREGRQAAAAATKVAKSSTAKPKAVVDALALEREMMGDSE